MAQVSSCQAKNFQQMQNEIFPAIVVSPPKNHMKYVKTDRALMTWLRKLWPKKSKYHTQCVIDKCEP